MWRGHRTRLRSTCVSMGCPFPPYIQEWRRGGSALIGGTQGGSPTPSRSRFPVTPSMRLYLPRVEARLRGITALWALQVGNQSHPRLRSPLLDRTAGVVESRTKMF